MNQRITRRRFGQLAIAGTAVAGLGYLANKTFAQTPNLTLVGVRPSPITSTDTTASPEVNTTELNSTLTALAAPITASLPVGLEVQSLNMTNNNVQNLASPRLLADASTPILQSNEELSGFTTLADGTPVVAITPVSGSNNEANPTRLTVLGASPTTVSVSGLNQQEKVSSLVATKDGALLGIALKQNGTPPVRLVEIDLQSGKITNSSRVQLPPDQRFITLTQCPDGTLYTITTDRNGITNLVKLDQDQKKPIVLAQLSFNGSPWNSGLQSLVCTSAGQLLAFGAPRYVTPYNLYTVDVGTGAMSLLRQVDFTRVTISGR